MVIQWLLVSSWLPGSWHRVMLLRLFGANIDSGVVIKPRVRVKFPWRLQIGSNSWIGEQVWIDNLDWVTIGQNCCLSQSVYLCTGSHDWSSSSFDLIVKPIVIHDSVWLCANSTVGPGVVVNEGGILSLGSVASRDLEAWKIYRGNPADVVRCRQKCL